MFLFYHRNVDRFRLGVLNRKKRNRNRTVLGWFLGRFLWNQLKRRHLTAFSVHVLVSCGDQGWLWIENKPKKRWLGRFFFEFHGEYRSVSVSFLPLWTIRQGRPKRTESVFRLFEGGATEKQPKIRLKKSVIGQEETSKPDRKNDFRSFSNHNPADTHYHLVSSIACVPLFLVFELFAVSANTPTNWMFNFKAKRPLYSCRLQSCLDERGLTRRETADCPFVHPGPNTYPHGEIGGHNPKFPLTPSNCRHWQR